MLQYIKGGKNLELPFLYMYNLFRVICEIILLKGFGFYLNLALYSFQSTEAAFHVIIEGPCLHCTEDLYAIL